MILLDTNVVSEMRLRSSGRANPNALAWIADRDADALYISAASLLEIELGVLRMERRDAAQGAILREWMDAFVLPSFASRVLAVEQRVALVAARLHVPDPRPFYDALIAATALAHNLTLATRNVRDFAGTGVRLVNPWDYRVGTGSAPE